MSEELEKKNLPKATLIKHKKPATDSDASKAEKKKVVVVKKKKKPVVKAVHTDNSKSDNNKQSVKNAPGSGTSKTAAGKSAKGERPLGGSRKGRSQDDIYKAGGAPESSADNEVKTEPRNEAVSRESSSPVNEMPGRSRSEVDYKRDNNRQGGSYQGRSYDNRRPQGDNRQTDNRQGGGYQGRSYDNRRPQGDNRQTDNRQGGGYQGRSYDNRRPQGDNRQTDNRQGGGYQGRSYDNRRPQGDNRQTDNRQGGGYQGRSYDNRRSSGPGSRPGGPGGRPGPGSRPGSPGGRPVTGGRPGGPGRPGQGGRPAGNMPAPGGENKKSAGRKVFKTKKKADYKKKNDFELEKDFQIKKKTIQRANPVPSEIEMMEVITVSDLARKMNLKASELIAKLMSMGMMVTINQQIDAETAELLASEYKCKVKIVSLYDETIIESEKDNEEDLKPRPPIVTVMGHVDHGKTKLLDAIRKTDIVADEHGGITQHIGASKVDLEQGSIVFLDTPGHEAFTLMRARGAEVTDIVVLVVAANDGVMPQTVEAINHAKQAKVPIIIAVNKCDLPDANIDRVKQQLSEYELMPEDWGGTTLFNEISALKGTGISELLDNILLQAELLELKANVDCRAEGTVIESRVDQGRGIVSSVIIERGTLRIGDSFVAGVFPGKVRALFDDKGYKITEAGPATPVEILGFTGIPNAGAPFQVTENEKTARMVGEKRQELEKQGRADNLTKVTLDNLYDSIQEGEIQELKVIIKGDVHGSVEALQTSLKKLSTSEIKLTPIHAAAGAIVENDVTLASASNAIIIGFHVRPTPKALALAEQEKVDIRKYNIIYDAVADIKAAMEGMLAPELSEETLGTVEVREVFKVPKIGLIAGCYVKSGKVRRNESAHIIRDGVILHSGKITSLKRFKDDVREVDSGYECGIGIENYLDVQVGDEFEVYVIKETARNLD